MWGSHWTIELEKRGIPGVYVVGQPFSEDVRVTLEKEGMPYLRTVVVPHPCGLIPDEQYSTIIPKLVEALTMPLSEKEKQTGTLAPRKQSRIVVAGTLDEVQDYFNTHRCSDGLPIMPPTEEKVKEMLKGTSHSPDEVVTTTMWPERLTVTVEKVAIVGVMAGCKPEYMPVLLAICEAFGKSNRIQSPVRSTLSQATATLVNGPIRNEIGMNSGIEALGPCNRANATIGRFLRLAMINLGDAWPGINIMGSQGRPIQYNCGFPENEEKSPWEPFHVSKGYKPEESTVTIYVGLMSQLQNMIGKSSDLDRIAEEILHFTSWTGVTMLLDPMVARTLAAEGMSKQDVEEYVWSRATTTVKVLRRRSGGLKVQRKDDDGETYWPASYNDLPDDAVVPAFPRRFVNVIVVGGETNPLGEAWYCGGRSMGSVDKWR